MSSCKTQRHSTEAPQKQLYRQDSVITPFLTTNSMHEQRQTLPPLRESEMIERARKNARDVNGSHTSSDSLKNRLVLVARE